MGFILSDGAVGTIIGHMKAGASNLLVATELSQPITAINTVASTAGSFMTSTGVIAANVPHHWWGLVTFTCSTSGTFNLQWGSEVNASAAQLNTGSSMLVSLLN